MEIKKTVKRFGKDLEAMGKLYWTLLSGPFDGSIGLYRCGECNAIVGFRGKHYKSFDEKCYRCGTDVNWKDHWEVEANINDEALAGEIEEYLKGKKVDYKLTHHEDPR